MRTLEMSNTGWSQRPRAAPRPTPPAPPPSPDNLLRPFDLNLDPEENEREQALHLLRRTRLGRRHRPRPLNMVPLDSLPDALALRNALLAIDLNRAPAAGQVPRLLAPVPLPMAAPDPARAPPRRLQLLPSSVIRPVALPFASRSSVLAAIVIAVTPTTAAPAPDHHPAPHRLRTVSPFAPPVPARPPSPPPTAAAAAAAAAIRTFSPPAPALPSISPPPPAVQTAVLLRPSSPPHPQAPPAAAPPPAAAALPSTPPPPPPPAASPPPDPPRPAPPALPSTSPPDPPASSTPPPSPALQSTAPAIPVPSLPPPPPQAPAALPSISSRPRAIRPRPVSTPAPPPPPAPAPARPAPAKRPRLASPPPPPPRPVMRSPPPPAVRPRPVTVSPPTPARNPAPKRRHVSAPTLTPALAPPALPSASAPAVLRPRASGIVIRENNEEAARERAARNAAASLSQRGASNSRDRAKDKGKGKAPAPAPAPIPVPVPPPTTDQLAENDERLHDVPIQQVLSSLHPQIHGPRRSSRTTPPTLLGSSSQHPRQALVESRELVALEALGSLLPALQGASFEGSNQVNGHGDSDPERQSTAVTRDRRSKSASDRHVSWHDLELTVVPPCEMRGYIHGSGGLSSISKRGRTTSVLATTGASANPPGVSRWERLPAGLYHAPSGSRMETARKAGVLSFFLGYSLRERAWLQANQRDLMNGLCSPPKHQQPKSRKLDSRKSRFQGVNYYRRTKRWEAHIWETPKKLDGKQQYLGSCYNELEAARHYDRGSLKFRGPNTTLNFKSCSYKDCKKEIYRMTRNQFLEWSRCMARRCIDSHFFGTRFDPRRNQWKAEYKIQNPVTKRDGTLSCGFFETEEEAARAYDQVSIEVNGSVAITNFSLLEYNIQSILRTSSINRHGLHRVETEHLRHKTRSKAKKTKGNEVVAAKSSPRRSGRIENGGQSKLPCLAATPQDHQVTSGQIDSPSPQSGPTLTLAEAANVCEELERSRTTSATVEPLQVLRLGGSHHPSAILNAQTNLDPMSGDTTEAEGDDSNDQRQARKRKAPTTEMSNIPLWTDKKSRFWRPG